MFRTLVVVLLMSALATGCGDGDEGVLSVQPTDFDFGRVRHGSARVTEFTVRNNGEGPLRVTAKPNCGCFRILQGSQASLEPGESMLLRVRFDSGKLPAGPMRTKRIDIFTDDPGGAFARVPITGDVYKPVKIDPSELRIGRITEKVEEFNAKPFRVRPLEPDTKLKVQKITVIPSSFVKIEAKEVGRGLDLHLQLLPNQRRPQGDIFAAVDLTVLVLHEDGRRETVALRTGVRGYWVADTQTPLPGK